MYKEFPFHRGDRDRSQSQARWEMRHNVQQFCVFFSGFLIFARTKASGSKMSEYSFHDSYITSVSLYNSGVSFSEKQGVEHLSFLAPETTWEGMWLQESCSQRDIFFWCKHKDIQASNMPKLESKSDSKTFL